MTNGFSGLLVLSLSVFGIGSTTVILACVCT